jgi:hypothetical protein
LGKFFLIADIYFGIFFLPNKLILVTNFLTIKRVQKAANKWGDLHTISKGLSKTFLCFRNRFPKQFYNKSSGFPTWFLANQNIQKP